VEPNRTLSDRIALVAGGTRGAGRATAIELGAAGATVYVTGRTTETSASPMNRPETIEETARLVDTTGGNGIPVRVDHSRVDEVGSLIERIRDEQGRLDVLVNDVWGGDDMTEWEGPFWEHDLDVGLALLRQAIDTHIITSWHAGPLLAASSNGLVVEVTDGVSTRYRGTLFYDLAKATVIRLAVAQAEEFRAHDVSAVAISPGFLSSEAMLERFGVTEATWRDAVSTDPHFAQSETPHYLGRAIAAIAADPDRMRLTGTATATWELFDTYGFTDLDGTQPNWGDYMRIELHLEP
jgi:NAD(P)-dependent dehydrogenase (short-subunit alcohol dehydrogenase family)